MLVTHDPEADMRRSNLAVQRTWRGVKSSEARALVASPAVVAVVVKLT